MAVGLRWWYFMQTVQRLRPRWLMAIFGRCMRFCLRSAQNKDEDLLSRCLPVLSLRDGDEPSSGCWTTDLLRFDWLLKVQSIP